MEREQRFSQWLREWKPKNTSGALSGGIWKEDTLAEYIRVLKRITADLKMDKEQIKLDLFDYEDAREFLIVYGKIINHPNYKSLQYFPVAKKALKRYLDFLYEKK